MEKNDCLNNIWSLLLFQNILEKTSASVNVELNLPEA